MKNTIKILILSIFTLIVLSLLTCVNAATASISANKTNATVGENVTITVNVNAASWSISVGGATTGRMTGYNEDGVNQNASKQFSLSTATPGTYTVLMTGDVTDQSSDYSTPVSGSVTVVVTAPVETPDPPQNNNNTSNGGTTTTKPNNNNTTTKPTETKSSNSRLSSLKIAEGAIAPEFDSGIREYAINVSNEVTKLTIEAIADDLKSNVVVTGNEELQVGENTVEITVTAEDGSKTTYTIKAVRADEKLALKSLEIFYINENGEKVPLELDTLFGAGIYEYTLKDISYKIDKLLVEAIANKELAIVDITGNENLKEGKNEIKITVTMKNEQEKTEGENEENQEITEETVVYTITVNKEATPAPAAPLTFSEKMKNFFSNAGTWISENSMKIQAVALIASSATLAGLTIYFVYDYKNYKKLLAQLAEINKTNLMEKANVALGPEKPGKVEDIVESAVEATQTEENETEVANEEKNESEIEKQEENPRKKLGRGRRFRE